MEQTITQPIFDQFTSANRILVALPQQLHPDTLGSALALSLFLKKLGKEVDVVSAGPVPANLSFLPALNQVKSKIDTAKTLVVALNTAREQLEELSYQTLDNKVNIYLKPKTGSFTPEDISLEAEKVPYSLVVTLDCASLADLGELFENNTDLFFETPKVNIDHHVYNQYFGALNLVDITASSTAEILTTLFEQYERQLIDEDIATCLLTGIIAKTNSFQHVHTTPKAFLKASQLINLGGRQQEIIKHLYKTKTLSFLRLWGRALARLKTDLNLSLAYSLLSQSDMEKAESSEEELVMVLKELAANINNYKIVALLTQGRTAGIRLLLTLHQQFQAQDLQKFLPGTLKALPALNSTYNLLEFELAATDLVAAEAELLQAVAKLPGLDKV